MICKDGSVRSRQVKTQEAITPEVTEAAKKALNKCFVGITPEQVNLNTVLEFESALGDHKGFATMLLRVVNEMFNSFDREKVHIDGVTKLLSHPEFFDVAKVQSVLSMIEERKRFGELMKRAVPGRTSVVFGDESAGIAPPDTGFVFHPITVGGKVIGAVGVIGPKRMDYKKIIASLDYFAEGLTATIDSDAQIINMIGDGKDDNGKDDNGK